MCAHSHTCVHTQSASSSCAMRTLACDGALGAGSRLPTHWAGACHLSREEEYWAVSPEGCCRVAWGVAHVLCVGWAPAG